MPLCGIVHVGGADAVVRSARWSAHSFYAVHSPQSTVSAQLPRWLPRSDPAAPAATTPRKGTATRALPRSPHRAPRRVRRRFRRFRRVGGRGVLRCLSAREPTPVANCDLQIFVGIHLRRRRVTSKISGTSAALTLLSIL